MINEAELAKMQAYSAENHGYDQAIMYLRNDSLGITVDTDSPYNGALSNNVHVAKSRNITVYGNIDRYDNDYFIIPLAVRYYEDVIIKLNANARIQIPVGDSAGSANFREMAFYLIDFTATDEDPSTQPTLLERIYYVPQPPTGQNASVPIRNTMHIDYIGTLDLSDGHEYGIGCSVYLRKDDSFSAMNFSVELDYLS